MEKDVEERRVIYVGAIVDGTTRADLRRRFEKFGPIVDVSIHFRKSNLSRQLSKVLCRWWFRRRGKTGKQGKVGVKRNWWS